MDVKHPEITIKMVGQDGNAYSILGRCVRAMRRAGFPQVELDAFMAEATGGDYDHLLRTVMQWFETE